MGLRVDQFVTTCHVPRRYRKEADAVDRLARGRFSSDLAVHLGPSLSRQPAVVRIRRLSVRVVIPGTDLSEDAISRAWTQAFGRALFTALSAPSNAGPIEVFRADSFASFVAGAIRALSGGEAFERWQYAEFEPMFRLGKVEGALALLCEWPAHTLQILVELSKAQALDRILARFDELALERIFSLLARPGDVEPPPLTIAELVSATKHALNHRPPKATVVTSRRFALSLFVNIFKSGGAASGPRRLFHLLRALDALLRAPDLGSFVQAVNLQDFSELSSPSLALLQDLQRAAASTTPRRDLSELMHAVSDLRFALNIRATPAPHARWISTDWCGLFFATSTLQRLGWISDWENMPEFRSGRVSCLLAGVALSIAGDFETDPRNLESGIALFSGYLNEPDLAHFRRVVQDQPRAVRLEVLGAAVASASAAPRDNLNLAAESWSATFDFLANRLALAMGARIRGFRTATRDNIVRTFLHRAGRIRIEDNKIVVVPSPSPYHVALRIAGLLDPGDSLSWLGGRRLEFEVGDL